MLNPRRLRMRKVISYNILSLKLYIQRPLRTKTKDKIYVGLKLLINGFVRFIDCETIQLPLGKLRYR